MKTLKTNRQYEVIVLGQYTFRRPPHGRWELNNAISLADGNSVWMLCTDHECALANEVIRLRENQS